MAVISPQKGVVGFVRDVSPHLATIQSLLHKDTKISVNIKKNMPWVPWYGEKKTSITGRPYIKDIPNHFKVNLRDTVVTSGYGSFPPGIPVGSVSNSGIATGDNFLTIEIELFNDFSTLQYVYVIKDKFAEEQKSLETKLPNE